MSRKPMSVQPRTHSTAVVPGLASIRSSKSPRDCATPAIQPSVSKAAVIVARVRTRFIAPPKGLTAFRVDEDVMAGLWAVKARDFISLSVQVDQALRAWLNLEGFTLE